MSIDGTLILAVLIMIYIRLYRLHLDIAKRKDSK